MSASGIGNVISGRCVRNISQSPAPFDVRRLATLYLYANKHTNSCVRAFSCPSAAQHAAPCRFCMCARNYLRSRVSAELFAARAESHNDALCFDTRLRAHGDYEVKCGKFNQLSNQWSCFGLVSYARGKHIVIKPGSKFEEQLKIWIFSENQGLIKF